MAVECSPHFLLYPPSHLATSYSINPVNESDTLAQPTHAD